MQEKELKNIDKNEKKKLIFKSNSRLTVYQSTNVNMKENQKPRS